MVRQAAGAQPTGATPPLTPSQPHRPTPFPSPCGLTWKASTLGSWLLQVVESTLKSLAAPGQKVASKAMKRSLGPAYLGGGGCWRGVQGMWGRHVGGRGCVCTGTDWYSGSTGRC
jgi:hypothetical protein